MRERIVEAAAAMTAESGWSGVTMGALAERVGVSRQTVYNEIGTKPGLAEAMILHELDRFLGVVTVAFDEHPTDLVAAIRAASLDVLELAQDNPLLHAVVSATHGADTELLPLLTTHAGVAAGGRQAGRRRAGRAVRRRPGRRASSTPPIDMVVRVVLSHVMQPSALARRDRRRHRLARGAGAPAGLSPASDCPTGLPVPGSAPLRVRPSSTASRKAGRRTAGP